jgi:hypothetical protein
MMRVMDRTRRPPRRHQRGEVNLPRLFTIAAIFVAMLLLPLYFLKDKAKAHKSRAPAASAPAADKP